MSFSVDLEDLSPTSSIGEDIWAAVGDEGQETGIGECGTWESPDHETQKRPPGYLGTAISTTLNTGLERFSARGHSDVHINLEPTNAPRDPAVGALVQLGLGRESTIFAYDIAKQCFCVRRPDVRTPEFYEEPLRSLTAEFIKYGNQMRGLRSFADETCGGKEKSSAIIAVAVSISSIVNLLTSQLIKAVGFALSVLQLHSIFRQPSHILDHLTKLVESIRDLVTEEEVLSKLYGLAQVQETAKPWLCSIVQRMLGRASEPWLHSLSMNIGLFGKRTTHFMNGGSLSEIYDLPDGSQINQKLGSHLMPDFITASERESIHHTRHGLRLLEKYIPDHILTSSRPSPVTGSPPLELRFGWADIERIRSKAKTYESNIMSAMNRPSASSKPRNETKERRDSPDFRVPRLFKQPASTNEALFSPSLLDIEEFVPQWQKALRDDILDKAVMQALDEGDDRLRNDHASGPPIAQVPTLCLGPPISAQARLVNLACLRLLFKGWGLRSYMSLQRYFHLFGNGFFASRLSHVLLDPDSGSMQGFKSRGHADTRDLRHLWPPATPELRLSLMGVLAESYNSSELVRSLQVQNAELPGGLSFAVRELSEGEMQKCMDPDSLYALDFLCLQHKPLPPLDSVITSSSLEKYDAIFRLLLRMTRMLFVVNHLSVAHKHEPENARCSKHVDLTAARFRIEALHFVSTLCAHFMDNGVNAIWSRYENELADLDRQLDGNIEVDRLDSFPTLHLLQIRHERVLNDILFALLLRKRQKQAMKLLEEILELILLFAKREGLAYGMKQDEKPELLGIFREFRKKVGLLITACRRVSQKEGYSSRTKPGQSDDEVSNDHGGNAVDQLLLKLDMNGFYSRMV